jgi:TolB-like protein/DNA-binding winged helix-turn-helix (wHTH) protein
MATLPRATSSLWRFDVFELDTRTGELRKRGAKVRLQGQPLLVLAVLLERAGDLVTREELREQIWLADTFVDFDHSLHNAIARLRDVLGDSPEHPRYIETLPRRGYRFIAPVEKLPAPGTQSTPESEPVSAPPEPVVQTRSRPFAAIIGSVLLIVALGVAMLLVPAHRTNPASPIRSIAVLPLANFSGDPSQDYFVDGMTDELITDLAKVGSLRVTSRTSVMPYKGTKKRLPEIARELNVDGIVEGSVTRSGQRVRITAQLLEGSTDKHLWAETYDRDLGDVLKLQGELAGAIAQQVRAQLSPMQQAQIRQAHVVDPAAHDAYLRGRLYFVTEFYKPESVRKAQDLFQQSIQRDPNFALAYAGLADTYVFLAYSGAVQKDQASRSAKDALAKALALDDSVGEAYDTLGTLSEFNWDWAAADRAFNRAIALAPSYSCAHEDRAVFLATTGRRAEALAEIAKIDQLDYGLSAAGSEISTYYALRDYPDLVEASKRAMLLDSKGWWLHYEIGIGYEGTGKLQEAISEYQKAAKLSDGDQNVLTSLAHADDAIGDRAEAVKILRDLERKSKQIDVPPYVMATTYAGLGDREKAFEFLEKAYQVRAFDLSFLGADLRLDHLHSDPRFQNLLSRVGLPN